MHFKISGSFTFRWFYKALWQEFAGIYTALGGYVSKFQVHLCSVGSPRRMIQNTSQVHAGLRGTDNKCSRGWLQWKGMQDRPCVLLAVFNLGLVIGILSSLPPPGWSVLMKRAWRLCMGGARRDCKEQELLPRSGWVAPYRTDHVASFLAQCVKL